MDLEKISKFIRELREEKGLTQEELASLIPIGREAISKWERGKNRPDKLSINALCKIFDVTVDEILLGKRISEIVKDNSINKEVTLNLYEGYHSKNQKLKIAFLVILSLVLYILLSYFISNFNSIKIYTIDYTDNDIVITNGLFSVTKDKIYFNIGNIETKEEIKSLKLFYKNNDDDVLIFKTEDTKIYLVDFYGYNAYFDYNKINIIIKNLYLLVEFEDKEHTIKLNVKEDFNNNKFFYKSISNEILKKDIDFRKYPDKYKNYFECGKNICHYVFNDFEFNFVKDNNYIVVNDVSFTREWLYDTNTEFLTFKKYDNFKVVTMFSFNKIKINCELGQCDNYLYEINTFSDILQKFIE